MARYFLNIYFFLFLFGIVVSIRNGTHEEMYRDLDTNAVCFRRLNGTQQFGCSSSIQGDIGILHVVKTTEDWNTFLENSTSENYVIALYINLFTEDFVSRLLQVDNIAGVLLIVKDFVAPPSYSPDVGCPNSFMDFCNDIVVNPYGNGFKFIDWPFPMFMIDDGATIDDVEKCFQDFNLPFDESQLSRTLCSIQIKSHMSAAVNTPTCLGRQSEAGTRVFKYCDPKSDRNIILPFVGPAKCFTPRSTIVIATRLDSFSIFNGVSSGFMTTGTSVATLLSTANALSKMMKSFGGPAKKHVIFMLLNGESQDYIGSSRIIYDIKEGNFFELTNLDLNLESIEGFIELSQINSNSTVFLHGTSDLFVRNFQTKLMAESYNYSFRFSTAYKNLIPPSSFLVFRKADPLMPGIVISGYDAQYTYKYLNGFLDSPKTFRNENGEPFRILQKNVVELSKTLASVIFNVITDSKPEPVEHEVFDRLVHHILKCYFETKVLCDLVKDVYSNMDLNSLDTGWTMYVTVQPMPNPLTSGTGLLLAYLTSEPLQIPEESCDCDSKVYSCHWIRGPEHTGLCLNTTVKFTPAISPAFLIDNYDWKSGQYSSWTESSYFDAGVQMFLRPPRSKEWITFSVGLTIFIFSFVLICWFNKKSSELFKPSYTSCYLLTTNC